MANSREEARIDLKAAAARRAAVSTLMAERASASTKLERDIQRVEDHLKQAEDAYREVAATPGPKTITELKSANRERGKAREKLDELKVIRKTLGSIDDGIQHYSARRQLDEARNRFAAAFEADQTASLGENAEFMGRLHKAYAAWLWRQNDDDWGLFLGATIPEPTEDEVDVALAFFEAEHAGPAMTLDETA